MNRQFVLICLLLFGESCQLKRSEQTSEINFPESKMIALFDLIDFDPRPDLPIHISFGKKISDEVLLLTIHQSKIDSVEVLTSEFKYKGHDVYIHRHPKYDDLLGRYNFFYDGDSPSWRILISTTENGSEYFLMNTLIQVRGDTLAKP